MTATKFDPRDQFTRDFTHARRMLREQKQPAWYADLLLALHRFSDYKTGAGDTSWGGLAIELAKDGIMASRSAIRYAFRRLQELGLVFRDAEANIDLMRLIYTVRTSITQTIGQCMAEVAKRIETFQAKLKRLGQQTVDRVRRQGLPEGKPPTMNRGGEHLYQRSPTGPSIQSIDQKKPEIRTPEAIQAGKAALLALRQQIRRGER